MASGRHPMWQWHVVQYQPVQANPPLLAGSDAAHKQPSRLLRACCRGSSCVGGPCSAAAVYAEGLQPSNGTEWGADIYEELKGALGAHLHTGA